MRLVYAGRMFKDFIGFARQNKIWWIVPLIVVLALAGLVVFAGQTVAPFIYTLF